MDPERLDSSGDTGFTRKFRNTEARQASEEKRQIELQKKRDQLKELEEVQGNDLLSNAQRKKLANLRKELRIDATSESVDPQSKPRYPESALGDNEDGKGEKPSQNPDRGDSSASVSGQERSANQRRKGYSGNPSTKTAPKKSPEERGGVAEAYCLCKSFNGNSRKIFRFGPQGPQDKSKYEFGPSKAHEENEIQGLPLISGKRQTIFDIKKNGRWQYGFDNIEKVINIVTLTPNPHRKWKPRITKKGAIHVFPTTLLKIQWCDIQEEHQKEFLKDGKSWNFRGKVRERLRSKQKVTLDEWSREVAKQQDRSYEDWLQKNGITDQDRPHTFFPGADWANDPIQSRNNRSRSVQKESKLKSSVLDGQKNRSTKDKSYDSGGSTGHTSSKKRPRADSEGSEGNSDRIKKSRSVPMTTENSAESYGSGGSTSHTSSKKRPRADSEGPEGNSDRIKKPRSVPMTTENSAEKFIDWNSYLFDLMKHYEQQDNLGKEGCEKGSDNYRKIMDDIHEGWGDYRQTMLSQGYQVLPGGEKPSA